jgi:hypothetical protein
MNKHVLEHVPVTQLPEDLQKRLPGVTTVTITPEAEAPKPMTREELLAVVRERQRQQRGKGVTMKEAVARIRELRDEWDY